MTIEKDIPYAGTKNPRQTLDLILPKNPRGDKPLPIVVNIHGGAWQSGDKSNGALQLVGMVATGNYAAATIGYRLSAEASHSRPEGGLRRPHAVEELVDLGLEPQTFARQRLRGDEHLVRALAGLVGAARGAADGIDDVCGAARRRAHGDR